MDTGKFLRIIEDIKTDEGEFNFQASFNNILNFYNQNNPDQLNEEREKIRESILKSRLNNYVLTDFEVLKNIDLDQYFGVRAWESLESILNSPAHEVKQKLEKFVQNRQAAINNLNKAQEALNQFGLKARFLTDHHYEIGFSFPNEYQNIASLEDVLGDIQNFLTSLAEVTGESKEFRINSVSNGTIEIFVDASVQLALHFDAALEWALKIYAAKKMFAELREKYQNFSPKRRKDMEAASEAEQEENEKELIEEFVNSLGVKDEGKISSVRGLFKKFLKHLQRGVAAEVRTPMIEPPRDPNENDSKEMKKQLSEQKKLYNTKQKIDARNREIFILQQNNFYGLNLLLPERGDLGAETKLDDKDDLENTS